MSMTFESLELSQPILRALRDAGYETPTPIQAKTIRPAMEGRDLLGCAQTGTGKTAAFALPILHRLHAMPADKSRRGPARARALVLSPTRELATQITESFETYGRHTGLRATAIFGGVSQFRQEKALQRGVDVIVATPGRLIDLMEQGLVDFREVGVFVLDEADRMLDMGFIHPIRKIAAALPKGKRQTLLFSATMPRQIMKLAESLLNDPVRVAVTPVASAAPLIEQSVYMVRRDGKQALLEHLLTEHGVERGLVFTKTKRGADVVSRRLQRAGVRVDSIHGNKSQGQRQRALDGFRTGRSRVLVATDVAARGLDVDGITHVFNYDLPVEPEAYVHRIGRTGRAGARGAAIAFCEPSERRLLATIERLTGGRTMPVAQLPVIAKANDPAVRKESGEQRIDRPMKPARPASRSRKPGTAGRQGKRRSAAREGGRAASGPAGTRRRGRRKDRLAKRT